MHAKYEFIISNGSKVIANVKVGHKQTNKRTNQQTNKQTDRAKTICLRSQILGHTNAHANSLPPDYVVLFMQCPVRGGFFGVYQNMLDTK